MRALAPRILIIHAPLQVGKYLVSPLTRRTDGGLYTAGVSIRSGSGSMTHDRVLRFLPVFDSFDQAVRYAFAQALDWIGAPSRVASAPAARSPRHAQ